MLRFLGSSFELLDLFGSRRGGFSGSLIWGGKGGGGVSLSWKLEPGKFFRQLREGVLGIWH